MKRTLLALAMTVAATPVFAQTAAPAAPCADADHRRFDFWVGSWDVSVTGKDRVVAHSLIERLYDGCTIRENWTPLKGPPGGSLSAYDAQGKIWRQAWSDASGEWAQFEGDWNGKALVIAGGWPGKGQRHRIVRMTYTPAADGSVRQFGEESQDQGKTWTPSFDYTYRKAS